MMAFSGDMTGISITFVLFLVVQTIMTLEPTLLICVFPMALSFVVSGSIFSTILSFAETRVDLTSSTLSNIQGSLVGLPNTVELKNKVSYYYNAVLNVPIKPFIFSFKYTVNDYKEDVYTVFDGYRLRMHAAFRPSKTWTLYYTFGKSDAKNDYTDILSQQPNTGAALSKSLNEVQYQSHHLGFVKNLSKSVKLKLQTGLAKTIIPVRLSALCVWF